MSANIDLKDIKKKAIKGGVLTISSRLLTIVIQISSIIVLSRLLSPTDFGLIAMVTAITAFMGIFRDMGLSTAVIQKKDLEYKQINTLFWLNTGIGVFLTLLTIALSPFIASFYNHPELQPVVMLLAITFVIASIGAQHAALLQRELNLKPKVIADIVGAAITLLTSIGMAYLGYGFWSLAWGTVIGAIATTCLYFRGSSFTPSKPKIVEGTRDLINFGLNVTLFEILNYFHRNLDNILIGRVWGPLILGLYSRAYQLMMLPISSLREPINAIALPVLSRLQDDPDSYKAYYKNIATLLAFLSMPLMAFLVVNAENIIYLALGKGWSGVVPIFVLLGISGFIQAVASLRGLVLLSLGLSKKYVIWGIVNTLCVSVAFILGVKWGAEGIAISYAIVNYAILYPSLWYFFKGTPLSPIDFFIPILVPVVSSIMAALLSFNIMLNFIVNSILLHTIISAFVFFIILILVIIMLPGGLKTILGFKKLAKVIKT
ncbi:lipopolysaccharide biosynthesis protein [Acinetobacter bouvetii]|uniref:Teichuronic acid biosynthesis protein TuaB n=1 Tax=Acinetobacter bouvetii TaxID=202951 RepID=A0A811GL85_9GAMM|nr:lipopolysaccharide biosynthesis protein [Acinetobacter bouvetii]CAB1220499.1 Teichuronic acid biosynthesis protein TuaB [Acinetobacter bouvetii]